MHLLASLLTPKPREARPPSGAQLIGSRVMLREAETGDWQSWRTLRGLSRDFLKPWEPEWPAESLTSSFFDGMLRRQAKDWRRGKAYGFLVFALKSGNEAWEHSSFGCTDSQQRSPPLEGGVRGGVVSTGANFGACGETPPRQQKLRLAKEGKPKFLQPPPQGGRNAFDSAPNTLIGGISLNDVRRGIAQKGTLGYWIGMPYAGQGFMTEAAGLVCEFAFETLKLNRVEASCLPHNEPSKRLLRRLGFAEEGYAKSYLRIDGQWQDHVLWGKTAG